MNANDLSGRLARVFGFWKVQGSRLRRNHRRTPRFSSKFGLEHLEDRTLLAGVTLTQLTDTALAGGVSGVDTNPAISGDGTKIAFDSDGDFVGNNADHSREVFVFDTVTNSVYQATFGLSGVSEGPSINRDGTWLAFQSNADLTGRNADGNFEIFLFDAASGNVMQVTDATAGDSVGAEISSEGMRIAFESTADLIGQNADGNSEIFLYDAVLGHITQVTDTAEGTNSGADINRDGTRIAFISTADLTGHNGDANAEVFLFDAATSSFTQVTDSTEGESARVSIDGKGTRIAFESTADLTGENADGSREIFWFDDRTGALAMVSPATFPDTSPESSHPSISGDGHSILFSTIQPVGMGNDSRGIFLIDIDGHGRSYHSVDTFGHDTSPYATSISDNGSHFAVARPGAIWVDRGIASIVLYPPGLTDLWGGLPPGYAAYSTEAYSSVATISGNGAHVAFQSNANHAEDNGDANQEVFLLDTTGSGITQVSNAARPRYSFSDHASANGDGTKIAFDSTQNLAGLNYDFNREIFLYDALAGGFLQVTDTSSGESTNPSINGDATWVVFESTADLTGNNADGNREIFLFDVTAGSVTQVTDTIGASTSSVGATISGDGAWIAFESTADFTGKNADGNREIFLFEIVNGAFVQVTETIGGASSGAAINRDGKRIAFDSYGDLTGSNVDRNREVYLYDVPTGVFTQVTDTVGLASSDASINGDGTKVAFSSRADLTGNNADGDHEIFLFDSAAKSLTQETDSSSGDYYDSYYPSISNDGTRIAFQSTGDHGLLSIFLSDGTTKDVTVVAREPWILFPYLPSLSGDGTTVAYTSGPHLYNVDWPPYTGNAIHLFDTDTSQTTEVTSTSLVRPQPIVSGNVTVTDDGSKIVFDSYANLTGHNADGNREIFLYDAATSSLTQLTDATDKESMVAFISGDGTRIAFQSNANPTGENADHNWEVFLYDVITGAFRQVTDTTGFSNTVSSITNDGGKIAFQSQADLTGDNADGNGEVFLYDAAADSFTQVTVTSGSQNGGVINSDGTRIAIASNADLTGNNADGNSEIFLFDTLSSKFAQVTDSASGQNTNPSLNEDGTKVAFSSSANLTGENADGNTEIYLLDADANSFTLVTDGGGEAPSISGDGTRIIFQSTANHTGQNADGNAEIFLATMEGLPASPDVHLFYNNSVHDGNGAVVTEADFQAIAMDKSPLRPGETATFATLSGYSRGINGLFIDVPGLPDDGAGIDGSDLAFTVGNDDFPDTWAAAPAPTSVGVFPNGGGGGADRIYVTFADGAIVDTWLRITVSAGVDTGLADPATFFYGSVPGDTGAALTGQGEFFGRDAADLQSVAIHLAQSADIENPYDLDRDGRVDAFDLSVIPVAGGGFTNPSVISAITPQAAGVPGDYDASGRTEQGDLDLVLLNWGADVGGLPADWINERPATGIVGQAALDRVLLNWGAATLEGRVSPAREGTSGMESPRDERLGGKDTTDRDLAFATFAATGANTPLRHGLLAALVTGRLSL